MFEPPVSTPILRMIAIAASRMRWYSLSVSVCAGATVIESPVCTPIGSKFSIEQMMTTLSARSRITSSSYSFQPSTDCSTSTSARGERCKPHLSFCSKSSAVSAIEAPEPPSVKLGRMIAGRPISASAACACRRSVTYTDLGTSSPISRIAVRKRRRSSAIRIESSCAPIRRMPRRSSTPLSASAIAQFSAVCPPSVGSTASGRSISRIRATVSGVIGSM